tara:strand:+ start:654 stop:893 length:240 start_codon:yes stop_codon:yes gene_type:complete
VHNLIHKFLDNIDSLKEGVDKNSERILKGIDLERMLENPRTYLKAMAKAFYEAHSPEILEAIDIGKSHAREIIGKTDKD